MFNAFTFTSLPIWIAYNPTSHKTQIINQWMQSKYQHTIITMNTKRIYNAIEEVDFLTCQLPISTSLIPSFIVTPQRICNYRATNSTSIWWSAYLYKKRNTPLNLCKPKSITSLMWIASCSTTCFSVAHQGWTLKNWENLNFNKVFYALVIMFLVSINIKRFEILPHLEFEPHFQLLVNYELQTLLLGAYEWGANLDIFNITHMCP